METLEELKAIIENAPSDATHACIENGTHYKFKVIGLDAEIYTADGWLCYSGCALPDLCGVRLISDINRIIELMEVESDIRAALKAANIQNRKMLDKTENLKEKIKDIGYSYRRVEQERDELRVLKFKKFNEEECWLYQGDGNDYLESLVCPVVISPEKLIDIINGDL